jgi:hypothetical protein
MIKIGITEELKGNARMLRARAIEAEKEWRESQGLGQQLGNKRKRRSDTRERKAIERKHEKHREQQLGKLGAASKVRRIDPATGEVIGGGA